MKHITTYILTALVVLVFSSCSDFLDLYPGDTQSPDHFWKTEKDAKMALIGCYKDWEGTTILYRDCGADNGYSHHKHEGWQVIGNGSMSSADAGGGGYDYKSINRCNDFMENIDKVPFKEPALKERYKAEVRFIRAYNYFWLTVNYGDVPLSLKTYATIQESRIPRNPKEEVRKFIFDELDEVSKILPQEYENEEKGHITKGAALALSMRLHLYLGEFDKALADGLKVKALNQYDLFPKYDELFWVANKGNIECISDVGYMPDDNDYGTYIIGAMLPNGDGGWSSIVPVKSLVDAYEMKDGLTIEEAKAMNKYDEVYPFVNRDPRLKHTILYPGQDWNGRIFDPFAKKMQGNDGKEVNNPDYYGGADNSSKSAFAVKKFAAPLSQYKDPWKAGMSLMACRYAEVLLTMAEAKIELNQIDDEMYGFINQVRNRAEMPDVDKSKYNNQAKLRDLIRRERRVELAMEGLRRPDIVRWGIAETVMNGKANGSKVGTVNYNEPDEDKRAKLDAKDKDGKDIIIEIEDRSFSPHNKYFPIDVSEMDLNKNLTQTEGYK